MLRHQGLILFEKVGYCRGGLVGDNVSLEVGFDISKAYAGPRLLLSSLPAGWDGALNYVFSATPGCTLSFSNPRWTKPLKL